MQDRNVMRTLKMLNLEIESMLNRVMAEYGLTASQCNVLGYLTNHCGQDICPRDIHATLGISRATVSSLLKKLKNNGFLVYEADPSDGRLKRVVLTEKADEFGGAIERSFAAAQRFLYEGFTEEEKIMLLEFMERMLKNMRNRRHEL